MPSFPVIVMVSGHFDPFHDGHLSYLCQAKTQGDVLICVIASDIQLLMKKSKVNIPEGSRMKIVDAVLAHFDIPHLVLLNILDTETTLVANALRYVHPDIFFRGGDKTLETMPPEERTVCEELGIRILHATLEKETHGATFIY